MVHIFDTAAEKQRIEAGHLMRAAGQGRIDALLALVQAGVPADVRNSNALTSAVHGGHIDCVAALLRHGADPADPQCRALANACIHGRVAMADFLLKTHVPLRSSRNCVPSFFGAAQEGHMDVLALLLQHTDFGGLGDFFDEQQPLVAAARHGRLDAISLLLGQSAFNKAAAKDNALIAAVVGKHVGVATLLLQHGAHANLGSDADEYLLTTAARNNDVHMVQLLLAHGADATAHESSALLAACGRSFDGVVDVLFPHSDALCVLRQLKKDDNQEAHHALQARVDAHALRDTLAEHVKGAATSVGRTRHI